MRIKVLITGGIFLLIYFTGFCQGIYKSLDQKSRSIPDSLRTYSEISRHLTRNCNSEKEKVRAIFIWISHNIKYDVAALKLKRNFSSDSETLEEVLRKREGVCYDYSFLFNAMCKEVGIKSYIVSGFTKDHTNKIADLSHAWNLVIIDSSYFFIDVTWAAGYVSDEKFFPQFSNKYFLVKPKEFIKDHMPFDPIWQILNNPINPEDFTKSNFSKLILNGNFDFKDSIEKFET